MCSSYLLAVVIPTFIPRCGLSPDAAVVVAPHIFLLILLTADYPVTISNWPGYSCPPVVVGRYYIVRSTLVTSEVGGDYYHQESGLIWEYCPYGVTLTDIGGSTLDLPATL